MRCIIIEDQPPAQRILKKYIEDVGTLELVGTFGDAINGLTFLNENKVDVIFLDIHLPKLSGIDFLKALNNPPAVILTTAFPDFALESYDLDVVDYLLKPFSFARFIKAISKIKSKRPSEHDSVEKGSVFIKSGYEFIKVNVEDILFIKADNDYTEIMLQEKKLLSNESLKHWLDFFGEDKMIRTHRSYLVNRSKIIKVSSSNVTLSNKEDIPIGRAYKDNLNKLLASD